jgi:hypothetical protein
MNVGMYYTPVGERHATISAKSCHVHLTTRLRSNHDGTRANMRRYYHEKSQDGYSPAWAVLPVLHRTNGLSFVGVVFHVKTPQPNLGVDDCDLWRSNPRYMI